MTTPTLITGNGSRGTFLLAHGAGASMDTPFMEAFAHSLAARGIKVVRFEFPYMAKRRQDSRRRPPDRAPVLLETFRALIADHGADGPMVIGGKSMGGRMATMVASEGNPQVRGVVCLGYPFHPPGKPDRLRTDHFPGIQVPVLIVQGERDSFGGTELVQGLGLPQGFSLHWAADGNHDLVPRKASGHTRDGNWQAAADAVARFIGAA